MKGDMGKEANIRDKNVQSAERRRKKEKDENLFETREREKILK